MMRMCWALSEHPLPKTAEEAAALARKLNVGDAKPYKTITDMVADPYIDAIWICSPNFTRIEVMEASGFKIRKLFA